MRLKIRLLKLLGLALCCTVLAGCAGEDLLPKLEVSYTWVSKEEETKEQLYEDQKACMRDAMMASPPAFAGEMTSGRDIRVFESCMRAKGWAKE